MSSESPSTNSIPELQTTRLTELLEQYRHDPELLKIILMSKTEQDKLRTEELRNRTEMIKLETTRIEYAMLRLQKNGDTVLAGLSRSPSTPSRKASREHVMEAIRNKVRANSIAKQAKLTQEYQNVNPAQALPVVDNSLEISPCIQYTHDMFMDLNLNLDWDSMVFSPNYHMN